MPSVANGAARSHEPLSQAVPVNQLWAVPGSAFRLGGSEWLRVAKPSKNSMLTYRVWLLLLVFESPVRSSYLAHLALTETETG